MALPELDEPTDADCCTRARAGIAMVDRQLTIMLARANRDELRDLPRVRHICKSFEAMAVLQMEINQLVASL